jgi:hypothetical protein
MEKLDINNIVEVQEIKELILHKPKLLKYFNELIHRVNQDINEEKACFYIKEEDIPNDKLLESLLEDDTTSDED